MPPGPRRQISDIGKLLDPPKKKKPKPSPKQRGRGLAAAARRDPAKVARGKKMIQDRRGWNADKDRGTLAKTVRHPVDDVYVNDVRVKTGRKMVTTVRREKRDAERTAAQKANAKLERAQRGGKAWTRPKKRPGKQPLR